MNEKKIEIPINNKYIIKNKSPKNKEECLSKLLSQKELKSNKQLTKKYNYFVSEKKSPSKINFFDDKKIITKNIIKKEPKTKAKKRQNKFLKNKIKDHEPSSLNSNLNIYKIIHSKDLKNKKLGQQSSSITTDSMNSYISNQSNKKNNKCINLFNKSDDCNSFKRKRIDSEISNNSNNKKYLYLNNENNEKKDNNSKNIFNKNKNIKMNNSNIKIKDIKDVNQNTKTNMMSPKPIRNKNSKKIIKNDNSDLPNNEFKTDVKVNGFNNNIIYNKSDYNLIFNKNNNNKNRVPNNKNYKKLPKVNNNKEKEGKNTMNTNIYNENIKKSINHRSNEKDKNFYKNDKNININNNNNINKDIYYFNSNIDIDNDNNNKQNEKDNEIYMKKNLNPVKKSLFSEHMNFLINHQDQLKINYNNNYYGINNNNFMNIPFNSLMDSTDKIDYESKFINYDLGKTTGTSISKDSFLHFANKNSKNNEFMKINSSKKPNIDLNIEENEKTQEEIEKLAKEYLSISKYWENKDEYSKCNTNKTNTITTVIDNNNFNDDTIFTDKNN